MINDAESGNVTLTLSGVDADADSVTVTLTDGEWYHGDSRGYCWQQR